MPILPWVGLFAESYEENDKLLENSSADSRGELEDLGGIFSFARALHI